MTLLLDTHAFLWFILDDPALSPLARDMIEEPENRRLASVASFWEMASKASLGKLDVPEPFEEFVQRQLHVNTLPHVALITTLPFHHCDPFDRLLIAQCVVE
jgi:PIN domain nuclease of toxin-antitoxin system